jgi:hypothetical protein
MSRNVFISYRFRDAAVARTVRNFFQAQGGKCEGRAVFGDTDVTEGGESAIRNEVNRIVQECEAVLVVVGDDSHNAPWIDHEVELARSIPLPIVAVQLPGTTGGVPARIRGAADIPFVEWSQDALCEALNGARRIR